MEKDQDKENETCNKSLTPGEWVSQSVTPDVALHTVELTLTDKQRCCFEYLYENNENCTDQLYQIWKNLKSSPETDIQITIFDVPETSSGNNTLELGKEETTESKATQDLADKITVTDVIGTTTENDQRETISTSTAEGPKQTDGLVDLKKSPETCQGLSKSTVNNVSLLPNDTSRSALQINFGNTSGPGDIDNDILPYPVPAVRQTKRSEQKYFVLTSKEAYHAKKEKQAAKIKEEEAKEERAKKRKEAKERKEMLKTVKEKVAKTSVKPQKSNTKQKNGKISTKPTASEASVANLESEEYFCIVCGTKYLEPITEDWIQCSQCKFWCHEACANIDKNPFFICDKCKK